MKPTQEQAEITEAATQLKGSDVLKVIAFAGAGKTTTLKGIASAKKERGGYLVFARQNAEEAKRKLAMTKCSAMTMHALAMGTLRQYVGGLADHSARTVRDSGIMNRFRIPRVEGWNNYRLASAVLRAMSAFSNSADQEFKTEHGVAALVSSVGDPEKIRDRLKKEVARDTIEQLSGCVTQMAEAFWMEMVAQQSFSYDMFLKTLDLDADIRQQAFGMFRYLMVDEGQDQNPVQLSILRKTGLPLIAVGDPYQQIFSWRGAENALAQLEGKELYLTQSFRFGEEIAETAREILSLRPDGGPKQRLIGAGNGDISKHEGAKIAFVCRTNSGVIDQALDLVRKGKSIHVDNMAGLIRDVHSAMALQEGRIRDVKSQDLKHLDSWEEMKIEAEEGDGNKARLVSIIEDGLAPDIEKLASKVSDPLKAEVMVCTAHRSKGMEWPAVVLGNDWKDVRAMYGRYRGAKKQSEKHVTLALEEYNALYVAATRPMLRLKGHDRIIHPVIEAEEGFGPDWAPDGGLPEGDWVRDYDPTPIGREERPGDVMEDVRRLKGEGQADDLVAHI